MAYDPAVQVTDVLNGNLDHRALVRLTRILQGHTADERALALDPKDFDLKQMTRLAQALTNRDPGMNVSKSEKSKLFDVLCSSLSARQIDGRDARRHRFDARNLIQQIGIAGKPLPRGFHASRAGQEYGSDIVELTAKLADRQTRLQGSAYFNPEFSTHANNTAEALSVVDQAKPYLDQYSKQFGVPKALLSGILASEIQFDTEADLSKPINAAILTRDDGAFRSHDGAAVDSILYLNEPNVRGDLKAAHLDGVTDFLNSAPIQNFLSAHQKSGALDLYNVYPNGDMGTKYAAVTALALAHRMWQAGQKNPATHIPGNFGDFLNHMSPTQMASIFGAYRAGASAEKGFADFDASKGIYNVLDGDKLAAALHDPRAAMGMQAYQSEPYFDYFTSLNAPQKQAH